jgi:hypothetical protein
MAGVVMRTECVVGVPILMAGTSEDGAFDNLSAVVTKPATNCKSSAKK